MKWLYWVAFLLVVVGSVNWGLYALGYNLVDSLTGSLTWLAKTVYILVGLSGLYIAFEKIKG